MSTLTEALAHMQQLTDLGCSQEEALENTCTAYELEFDSKEMLECMYEECMITGHAYFGEMACTA